MLLQTSEEDMNGTFSEYQFIDSVADFQQLSHGSLVFTSQITPLSTETAFQESYVSSTLDLDLSYMGE